MTFVNPKLRPLIEAARGQPSMADIPVEVARAQMAERTAKRPKGPQVHEVRDISAPGPGGEIPMRVYKPENPVGVAVAFHGGGWLMGNIESFDATCRHLANDSGLAIVNVDYRLAPEHPFPAAVDDAWAATQWIAENGQSLGLPADRLVVLGESAGGNLAAVVALMARDAGNPRLRLQVLVYPAIDARLDSQSLEQFAEGYLLSARDIAHTYKSYGLGVTVETGDWRLSPLHAPSHQDVAPALLITAECDPLRDDSEAYARSLLEAGVSASHVRYAGVTHLFFGMRGALEEAALAQKQVAMAMRDAVIG
jgi:acetyl esterase